MRKKTPVPEATPIANADPVENRRVALRAEQRKAARRKGRASTILSQNNSLTGA